MLGRISIDSSPNTTAGAVLISWPPFLKCASGGKSVGVMLNGRNLCLDTMSEVYDLLRPWGDHEFWDLSSHEIMAASIYVIGRQQLVENKSRVLELCRRDDITVVFGNSAEGSTTLIDQVGRVLGLEQEIFSGRLLLIAGGDLPDRYPSILHEHFLVRILDYEENLSEIEKSSEIFSKKIKPYKFLALNGRARPHRKYILERLKQDELLAQAIWTMLDGRRTQSDDFVLQIGGQDIMATNSEISHLPDRYEVPRYAGFQRPDSYPHQFVKHDIFNHEWGEIYLHAEPYIDTYFSLVTETVYETSYSFRTEKIAKVLAMGHPWVCAANRGFYQDLRDLGFRTFDGIIDESFDTIDNHQDRIDRLLQIVRDLCQQDLQAFLHEAEPVCKYNQQFLPEFIQRHRSEFPARFQQFIQRHARS